MRFRKLRIAWTATCVIACAILTVFWVRSFWWLDSVNLPLWGNNLISVGTVSGTFGIAKGVSDGGFEFVTIPTDEYTKRRIESNLPPVSPAFGIISTAGYGFEMFLPDWFLLITGIGLAVGVAADNAARQSLNVIRDAIVRYATDNAGTPPPDPTANAFTSKYLRGSFPKCPVGAKKGDATIKITTSNPPVADGSPSAGWMYNATTGDFIINSNAAANDGTIYSAM